MRAPASLPWPFRDILLYGELDNRPAHRVLYAYAGLLRRHDPDGSRDSRF
ncbi:hypothetical protein ACFZDG_26725 [Kitasatospora xanthocidica]